MLDILLDTLLDSIKMLPFLFGAYLMMEYMEHKASDRIRSALAKTGRLGPAVGALLGCVPQCGFSVAAANLYAGRLITVGTLAAVFISTSDEAIPVILAHPDRWGEIGILLACKVLIALVTGFFVDFVLHRWNTTPQESREAHIHDLCHHDGCGCENNTGILRPALRHTLRIFVFVTLVMFGLNLAVWGIGEQRLFSALMSNSLWQPALAALFGFIPNCAASVVLTEFYLAGSISFGSVVAGLSTGAGMGLVVLFKANRRLRDNLRIMAVLYAAGTLFGILLQMFVP